MRTQLVLIVPLHCSNDRYCCNSRTELRKCTEHEYPETNMTAGSSMANLTMGENMTGADNMTNESTSMMTNSS